MAEALEHNNYPDGIKADAELVCSQEPIHIPGTIQPHGACLVVDPVNGFVVVGASRNAASLLLALPSWETIIGFSLTSILGESLTRAVQERFQCGRLRGEAPWQFNVSLANQRFKFNVAVHTHMGLILVELESVNAQDDTHAQVIIRQLQEVMINLREAESDLDALARVTAQGLRLLTGYERVMVYRFDAEWNGQTIAEDKEAGWDQSFDGVLCPASDIPAQARELYRRTPMRWVADRDAPAMPIDVDQAWMSSYSPAHAIDLSFARLRSQSPVHLQIHRNLGISGSMSLSILYEKRLWGLMICHHRQPHYPSSSQQSAAAVLTDAFALRVGPVERTESDKARRTDLTRLSALRVQMAEATLVTEALINGDVTVAHLFTSTGAAVLYQGDVSLMGRTPPEADVQKLAVWLRTEGSEARFFKTNNLEAAYPSWKEHGGIASGLLAVFLSDNRSDMLLWFRPEQPQHETWGSSSHQGGVNTASALSAHPYQKWEGTRRGSAKPWAEWEVEMAEALRHDVTEVMVRSLRRIAVLNESLRQSQILETASQAQIELTIRRVNEVLEAKILAQQAQEATEAQFHFATQAGGLGIWKLQLGTRELTTSGMCKNNFGRKEDVHFTYDELLSAIRPDSRDSMKAAVDRSATKGARFEIELPIVRPNGAAGWTQMQAQVIYTDGGTIPSLVGISLDITERVLSHERIRQSQKIEAIGRLTAGVAHDFNNVLQALLGGIEIAIDQVADRPEVCADLELSLQAGKRGARLTSHLLSFSRQQILRPAPIDLSPLLKNLSLTLMRTLGHDIAVSMEIASKLPYALADAAYLDAALLNLALNARDAMPRGGKLQIEAHARDGHVVVTVTDTGEGMTPDVLMQACEPFFSTKGLKGSGLGLSMVQGFARQSGGELKIWSTPGQGTHVEIILPSAAQGILTGRVVKAEPARGQGRVLIVDDEPDVGRVMSVFLRKAGFEVVLVPDPNAALYELGAGLAFNALVTDYAMPGMNGADLVLCARELYPLLPALIITGYAGADGLDTLPPDVTILRKPFQREELALKVKSLIEGKVIVRENLSEADQ